MIHSPFKDGRLFLPWAIGDLPIEAAGRGPLDLAAAYAVLAALFAVWCVCLSAKPGHDDHDTGPGGHGNHDSDG